MQERKLGSCSVSIFDSVRLNGTHSGETSPQKSNFSRTAVRPPFLGRAPSRLGWAQRTDSLEAATHIKFNLEIRILSAVDRTAKAKELAMDAQSARLKRAAVQDRTDIIARSTEKTGFGKAPTGYLGGGLGLEVRRLSKSCQGQGQLLGPGDEGRRAEGILEPLRKSR